MAKKLFLLIVVLTGLSFAGCATYATRNGVITPLGYLTPSAVNDGRGEVVAEYTIIFGVITSGYEEFLRKTAGQDIDIIDKNYFNFYRIVKAVKKEEITDNS
jgi:outer membrane lipoprotein SlyB